VTTDAGLKRPIRTGDRFITREDQHVTVLTVWAAPRTTGSVQGTLARGTVLIALDQAPGSSKFGCYPEDYDGMEQSLIPAATREDGQYAAYYLSFSVTDIPARLAPLAALDPRPRNRLPRN
jgi:hypothetical protein